MQQLKVQNLYNTTITESGGIAGSGDVNFTVAVAPTYSNGFIIISPENAILREIMYYHQVSGNRIYVRAENRPSPKAHTLGEIVKINDVAEIFNTFSDMISQAFYVEKTGGLNVRVWGGYAYYNGSPITIADSPLLLTDNTTNYIKYSYSTNTISVDTVNSGNIKAVCTTSGGVITSIVLYTTKESFSDPSLDILTGTGIPSNSLGVDGCLYINNANGYLYKKIAGAFVYQMNITGPQGLPGLAGVWRGDYNAGTSYIVNDIVYYSGSSYICILASIGNAPTNITYWTPIALAGTNSNLIELRSLL